MHRPMTPEGTICNKLYRHSASVQAAGYEVRPGFDLCDLYRVYLVESWKTGLRTRSKYIYSNNVATYTTCRGGAEAAGGRRGEEARQV